MTDKNELEEQSRRKFLKTTGAVGIAATGVGAFGGSAAAQQQDLFDIGDVTVIDSGGSLVDVDVVLNNIDVEVLNNLTVRIRDAFKDIQVVNIEGNTTTVTLEDINVANANQIVVIVQALSSGGAVVDTEQKRVSL